MRPINQCLINANYENNKSGKYNIDIKKVNNIPNIGKIKINKNIMKQNNENIETNINEFDIFKIIFPDLIKEDIEDKKNKLKNILTIILKKEGTNELIKEKLDKLENFL